MPTAPLKIHIPKQEHTIPWFWPMAAAIEFGEQGLRMVTDNLRYVAEAEQITAPPEPLWATRNRIVLDLPTMRLRAFQRAPSESGVVARPVLIDAPYAGHSATIADYRKGQSLVETLQANGLENVYVTDWKSATHAMRDFDIDTYLHDIDVVVGHLGGNVDLIGLCQGGWMSAMFASRFRPKVRTLVLAGAPIDTDGGDGQIKHMAHTLPMSFYETLVEAGDGCMRGKSMLAGWKNMNPGQQYLGKFLELYAHIEEKNYIERTERFERWYENPIDLPGVYYLQAINLIFKQNQLAKGEFVALGQRLSLHDIVCPVYLLAGASDDITTREQVFNTQRFLGTPKEHVVTCLAEGGHIGLFMGAKTLTERWPDIARWIILGPERAN